MTGVVSRAGIAIAVLGAVAAIAFFVARVGGQPEQRRSQPNVIGSREPLGRVYAPSSPFNQPIGGNPPLYPRSGALVQGFAEAVRQRGFVVALHRWTVPVYVAKPGTHRYRVALSAGWAPARELVGVPIPSAARPDPSADGHLAIIDRRAGCEYDLWQARRHGRRWSASWANGLPLHGSGVFPHGLSARGSGFALLAGLIRPEELARGRIDHALIFSYPYTSGAGYVRPASETDGRSHRADAMPEGARLQLDPSFDVRSLPRYERIIAQALQRYGMYLGDTSGNASLYAVNAQSYTGAAYAGLLPRDFYADLSDIPVDRFRVLASGSLIRPGATKLVRGRCARFR